MECIDAQAAISAALDSEAPDRATLDAAKRHCDTCPDCAAFVRGLNVVKRASLPTPDPGLVDRVMTAVRKEAAEKAEAEAAAAPANADAIAAASDEAAGAATADGGPSPAEAGMPTPIADARPRAAARQGALAAWIAAAAVLLVGAGVIGVVGVRMMLPGQNADTTTLSGGTVPKAVIQDGLVPPPPQETPAAGGTTEKATQVPNYVTFEGTAYRLVGVSTTTLAELTRVGSTTSALDGGEQRARDVLQKSGSPSVFIENDKKEILEFGVVEREFQGRTYRLQSAELFSFGSWPSLPTEIPQPNSSDGAPSFTQVGPDGSGITIYRLTAGAPEDGIAVAPGTASSDPAAGNPGWTWWKPKPP